MAKGTPAMGKKAKGMTHLVCRRCGEHSFHRKKKYCSGCGYGRSARLRRYAWQNF